MCDAKCWNTSATTLPIVHVVYTKFSVKWQWKADTSDLRHFGNRHQDISELQGLVGPNCLTICHKCQWKWCNMRCGTAFGVNSLSLFNVLNYCSAVQCIMWCHMQRRNLCVHVITLYEELSVNFCTSTEMSGPKYQNVLMTKRAVILKTFCYIT